MIAVGERDLQTTGVVTAISAYGFLAEVRATLGAGTVDALWVSPPRKLRVGSSVRILLKQRGDNWFASPPLPRGYYSKAMKGRRPIKDQQPTLRAGVRMKLAVQRSDERSTYFKIGTGIGRLPRSSRTYYVYERLGRLDVGKEVEIELDKPRSGGWVLRFPSKGPELQLGSLVKARICFFHQLGERDPLGAYAIYAEARNGELLRVTPIPFVDPAKQLPVGSTISVRIVKRIEKGAYGAELHPMPPPGLSPFPAPSPQIGAVIVAQVERVGDRYARCLVANGVYGDLMGGESDSKANALDLTSLHRGAKVKVQVTGVISSKASDGRASLQLAIADDGSLQVTPSLDYDDTDPTLMAAIDRATRTQIIRDREFRDLVCEAFEQRCALCGMDGHIDGYSLMEAAHIIPKEAHGPDTLANGLCLCPLHHSAFDKGLLTIDVDGMVRVAQIALGREGKALGLMQLHNRRVAFPRASELWAPQLRWHVHAIFLDAD